MLFLHSYVNWCNEEQQQETWEYVVRSKYEWNSIACYKGSVKEYYNMFREAWGKDDLIALEMDIVPTDTLIEEMLKCPNSVCVSNYLIPLQRFKDYVPICKGIEGEYCKTFGMGLIKISLSAQKQIDINELLTSCNPLVPDLDIKLSKIMEDKGIFAHLHGWVGHNHSNLEPARWVF